VKAIQYRTYGEYQENRLVDLERTRLKEGEVLVEMRTVGINPLDNTFRSGHIYFATPEKLPCVGGQTGVGVVVESGNTAFKVGDRVFVSSPGLGLAADGTWREFVSAPASALSRVPAGIDDDHAAAGRSVEVTQRPNVFRRNGYGDRSTRRRSSCSRETDNR